MNRTGAKLSDGEAYVIILSRAMCEPLAAVRSCLHSLHSEEWALPTETLYLRLPHRQASNSFYLSLLFVVILSGHARPETEDLSVPCASAAMETTRHSPSFHELPHDVRFSIFLGVARSYDASGVDEALADIDNLSRTSTAWRATFREHKLLVYRAIVHHAVHPTVHRAAFVAYSVYEEDAERRKMREGCLEHFVLMPDVVQELRSNAWVREVDWNWRPPCVRQILRKHQLFEEMAGLVGSQIESSPASWNDNYETDYVTPSERHRIQRTLYYIEIFFYLQHLRNIELPDTTEELSLYPEWVDNDDLFCGIFTDIFSVVEIEQIRCAITMLMYMSAVGTLASSIFLRIFRPFNWPLYFLC